jgi:hypothetical protein
MDDKSNMARCKQCDHLLSFHGEDGCGTWLLGVRAVPLYRCACVVSVSAKPKAFPTIPSQKFETPVLKDRQETTSDRTDDFKATIAQLRPASEAAPQAARDRLMDVASELRRTAEELRQLEAMLDRALKRLSDAGDVHPGRKNFPPPERREKYDRRQRHYAMTADRRVSQRRRLAA